MGGENWLDWNELVNEISRTVALRWIIQRDGVASTIIGVRTIEQFNQNMQAIDINLSDEQMAKLTEASDTPLPYPYNVIQMVKKRDNA